MYIGSTNFRRNRFIGALPVGLKGKLYGQPFKVLVQYDVFGGVKAQLYEDEEGGGIITEITGRKGEVQGKSDAFADWAIARAISQGKITKEGKAKVLRFENRFRGNEKIEETTIEVEKLKSDVNKRAKLFVTDLHKEVVDFNKGDGKTKKATKKVSLGPTKAPARKAPAKKEPARKFKTIYVGPYLVPGYTVPKHARKIFLK